VLLLRGHGGGHSFCFRALDRGAAGVFLPPPHASSCAQPFDPPSPAFTLPRTFSFLRPCWPAHRRRRLPFFRSFHGTARACASAPCPSCSNGVMLSSVSSCFSLRYATFRRRLAVYCATSTRTSGSPFFSPCGIAVGTRFRGADQIVLFSPLIIPLPKSFPLFIAGRSCSAISIFPFPIGKAPCQARFEIEQGFFFSSPRSADSLSSLFSSFFFFSRLLFFTRNDPQNPPRLFFVRSFPRLLGLFSHCRRVPLPFHSFFSRTITLVFRVGSAGRLFPLITPPRTPKEQAFCLSGLPFFFLPTIYAKLDRVSPAVSYCSPQTFLLL